MTQVRLVATLALLLSGSFAGCGLVDAGRGGAPPGTLAGAVHYEGELPTAGRALAIAVYGSFPPTGPPLRALLLERYELPQPFVFEGLASGNYYVGALVDVDRMDTRHSGMLNAELDPYGYFGGGQPIALDAGSGAANLDVVLEDPR